MLTVALGNNQTARSSRVANSVFVTVMSVELSDSPSCGCHFSYSRQ